MVTSLSQKEKGKERVAKVDRDFDAAFSTANSNIAAKVRVTVAKRILLEKTESLRNVPFAILKITSVQIVPRDPVMAKPTWQVNAINHVALAEVGHPPLNLPFATKKELQGVACSISRRNATTSC